MNTRKNAGFTLIELMIVVAIIAVIASIAIPKLMSARISANENAAIATLRSIASAQAQIESACAVDTDADGGGEYAYFGELAGSAPLRVWDKATLAVALEPNGLTLDPPILPSAFREVVPENVNGFMVVERSGYMFQMWLPGLEVAGVIPGVPETGPPDVGGATAGNFPDADNCEVYWACYAWPAETEATGNRAFFINQEGDLLQTLNNEGAANTAVFYEGLDSVPAFDAAYSNMAGDPNPNVKLGMGASMGISELILPLGQDTNDLNVWTVVGN